MDALDRTKRTKIFGGAMRIYSKQEARKKKGLKKRDSQGVALVTSIKHKWWT